MQVHDILRIAVDEHGRMLVHLSSTDEAVMAVTSLVWERQLSGDKRPMDLLFSVVVHYLAQELSGNLEADFLSKVEATTPIYRETYRNMRNKEIN